MLPVLGDNAFEVFVADHPEKIGAVSIDVIGIKQCWIVSLHDQLF